MHSSGFKATALPQNELLGCWDVLHSVYDTRRTPRAVVHIVWHTRSTSYDYHTRSPAHPGLRRQYHACNTTPMILLLQYYACSTTLAALRL